MNLQILTVSIICVGASFPLAEARKAIQESQRPGRGGKVFLES